MKSRIAPQPYLILLILSILASVAMAQPAEKRLVRLEKELYGWYAVVEPSFDHTVGRRTLYKVSGQDKVLSGLAGRLVILEGVFEEGKVAIPVLAAPPVSVPEGAQHRSLILSTSGDTGALLSEDGYSVDDPYGSFRELSGRNRVGVVVKPSARNRLEVLHLLSSESMTPVAKNSLSESGKMFLDLTLTQELVDALTKVGLRKARLSVEYQGVAVSLSQLRLLLPSSETVPGWQLQGSVKLAYGGSGTLAESSFVVAAQPVIEQDTLRVAPDWQSMRLEGQLPFSFILSGELLGDALSYLPRSVPLVDLSKVTASLHQENLLAQDDKPHWFLTQPTPATTRITLATEPPPPMLGPAVPPGNFRLALGQSVVDRLLKRQVSQLLDPDEPYRPDPPIKVAQALFIPITIDRIFIKNLVAGYRDGALQFEDLVVDVGWRAGPVTGQEPLFSASGQVVPQLLMSSESEPYWSWVLTLRELEICSDKMPGDKEELKKEFVPTIEKALGADLAEKNRIPALIPLDQFLEGAPGSLVFTRLQVSPDSLELEGVLQVEP